MSGRNGNTLLYTVMGFMFVALMTTITWAKVDIDRRVQKVEDTRDLIIALKTQVEYLQVQTARLARKIDDQRDALVKAGYRVRTAGPEDWP